MITKLVYNQDRAWRVEFCEQSSSFTVHLLPGGNPWKKKKSDITVYDMLFSDDETMERVKVNSDIFNLITSVVTEIVEIVKRYDLEYFWFSCEQSRIAVYRKIAKRIAVLTNRKLVIDNNIFAFVK